MFVETTVCSFEEAFSRAVHVCNRHRTKIWNHCFFILYINLFVFSLFPFLSFFISFFLHFFFFFLFYESTAIHCLPYSCTVAKAGLERLMIFGQMYACVYTFKSIFAVLAYSDACIYCLIFFFFFNGRSWWLGHSGEFRNVLSFRSEISEAFQATGRQGKKKKNYKKTYQKNKYVHSFILKSTHNSLSCFQGQECCSVINLKWVEHTGPDIVHLQLCLCVFALSSTGLFCFLFCIFIKYLELTT